MLVPPIVQLVRHRIGRYFLVWVPPRPAARGKHWLAGGGGGTLLSRRPNPRTQLHTTHTLEPSYVNNLYPICLQPSYIQLYSTLESSYVNIVPKHMNNHISLTHFDDTISLWDT